MTELQKREKKLIEYTEKYIEYADEYMKAEEKYKIIRAKAMNLDRVVNLPNQAMREAEMDIVLNNDDRFKQMYLDYKSLESLKRKYYYMMELYKELVKNARVENG